MGKTYRIEDQEAPGGALIAELYTQSSLSNGKVLATPKGEPMRIIKNLKVIFI